MYVTVRASVQQDQADLSAPIPDGAVSGEAVADPEATDITVVVNPALLPEDVLHNRSQKIVLDGNGGFGGRLSSAGLPAAGYSVHLLRHGNAVEMTDTDSEGRFRFDGCKQSCQS